MKQKALAMILSGATLAGCVTTTEGPTSGVSSTAPAALTSNDVAVQRFRRVVARMEPVAERSCRQQVRAGVKCDFKVVLDMDPRQPSNAYQSQDRNGRPVLTFTVAILKEMINDDEVAFVFGHEAAHHISGHIKQTVGTATLGAIVGGGLAVLLGGGQAAVDLGTNLGGSVGARAYSKEHEIEADVLGARITATAGYNAVKGVAFFERIPDPGNRFLGTHPPNADRIAAVRRAARDF